MARIKIEGVELIRAVMRRHERRARDTFREAREAAYARLRRELAAGDAPRQAYDLDLTATEIFEEPKALPAPGSEGK